MNEEELRAEVARLRREIEAAIALWRDFEQPAYIIADHLQGAIGVLS